MKIVLKKATAVGMDDWEESRGLSENLKSKCEASLDEVLKIRTYALADAYFRWMKENVVFRLFEDRFVLEEDKYHVTYITGDGHWCYEEANGVLVRAIDCSSEERVIAVLNLMNSLVAEDLKTQKQEDTLRTLYLFRSSMEKSIGC